mmetsp:Transcript_119739/g.334228  ORF Transcript_119739/g.334228 Transcript_119739/m.334228 type:complete len:278 (-) Transcript_119739:309-1142(-)
MAGFWYCVGGTFKRGTNYTRRGPARDAQPKRSERSPETAFISLAVSAVMLGSSAPNAWTCMVTDIRSFGPKPYSCRVPPIIFWTAGMSFIIFIMLASGPSHSLTMPSSSALLAGCLNVSSDLVSKARAVSLLSFGGPAASDFSTSKFLLVRFHNDLFFAVKHCLSNQASNSSLVGYVSFSFPSCQLFSLASRQAVHEASSFSVHSANCSGVHSGNSICLGTVSPFIFTISMMKTSVAFGGIFGGFPLGPYASSIGMYISHLSPSTMSCMASVQPLMT